MCGRYYRRSDKQRIADAFKLGKLPDDFVLPPDFNVAPTTFQPVIRANVETGEPMLGLMRWGLVPHSAKGVAGFNPINVKAETFANQTPWCRPFERRRCLVPADGFYEWAIGGMTKPATDALLFTDIEVSPPKRGRINPKRGPVKIPYAFQMQSKEPFAFAGLWDAWKEPDGSWLHSFAILTTDANELMESVHDRMPVILKPSDYDRWLSREPNARLPIDLLRPYDADRMTAHPVDPRVGNVKNNEPGLCEAWACPPNSA